MTILEAIIFFIPAGIGNMAPVLAVRLPFLRRLAVPVDMGMHLGGVRLLGDHKTIRGFVSGTIAGGAAAAALHATGIYDSNIGITIVMGMLLGFGALFGDSVKSFFKRRAQVPSGKSWFPFDQLDYIIGGLLFIAPLQVFTWAQIGAIAVTYFSLHILSTNLGFLLGLKKDRI